MKKFALYLSISALTALYSCADCEYCHIVLKDSNGKIIEEQKDVTELCDSELSDAKSKAPQPSPDGDSTSEYSCE